MTRTVTAAPSTSTVTRSVTISPSPTASQSPTASPSPSSSPAGESAETSAGFLDLVGAGGFIACRRGSDAASHSGTPSTSLES
jgi:hypothetical protein